MSTIAFSVVSPEPCNPVIATDSKILGHWRLQEALGRGRWTTVYRAAPVELPSDQPGDYAIKVASGRDDRRARWLLQAEAAAGSLVSHPHVVPVLAWQHEGPRPYLVMPYLPGVTLRRQLEAGGPIPARFTAWWVRQVAEGVAALHAAGWLHGDIKPDNVIINTAGHATVIDLGFVQPIDGASGAGGLMGTPAYAAPERLAKHPTCSPASDVYSLGCMAYEMLTGEPLRAPHKRLDHRRQLKQAGWNDSTVTSFFGPLLDAMLAEHPASRPSLATVIDDLCGWELEILARELSADASQ